MLTNSAGETSLPDLSKAKNSGPACSKLGWQRQTAQNLGLIGPRSGNGAFDV